ncbi:hypothetical protein Dimus_038309 [Dionaea muscipula]
MNCSDVSFLIADMAPKNPKKRIPTAVPIPGERGDREPGEIARPPRSDKRSRNSSDSPPSGVADTTQTPTDLKGYADREQGHSGMARVLLREMGPRATLLSRPLKKRNANNYSPSYPAVHFKSPDYLCTSLAPVINNLPHLDRPIMTCEDNALAAVQAVAIASKADLDHYFDDNGYYSRDWINKDMRCAIARLAVTTEASLRSQNDDQDMIFDLNRDVGLLKAQQEDLKKEIEKYKGIVDNATADTMTARGEALSAKKDLEIRGHEYNSMKLDHDRQVREAEEARKETERVRQELEAEKRKGGTVDLAVIKKEHFFDWVDEWQETPAGQEWLSDSCRGARM